jgi:putative PIN family toxin of toxin-antitoxin system
MLSREGISARLFDAARAGHFRIVLSPAILRELRRGFFKPHIKRRYPLTLEEIAAYMASIQQTCEVVPGAVTAHYGTRDPKDLPILACAIEAGADYIVTDDRRDLLPLKHYHGIQLVSAPDFIRNVLGLPRRRRRKPRR